MSKVSIRNTGPIVEATLDLNKVNVFMGPQSSGKSTIAKIISYCTWIEKEIATNQSFKKYRTNKKLFKKQLETFHKIEGYFNEGSVIDYESEVIKLHCTAQDFTIDWIDKHAYKRSKISYIPAERNMVILPEMVKVTLPNTNVRSFLSDWFDACKCYSEEKNLPLLDLGFRYYYSEKTRENHIKYEENGKSYDILLSNASSGLQSVIPMIVMIEYLTLWIYTHKENMSIEQLQLQIKVYTQLIDEVNENRRKMEASEIKAEKELELFNKINNIKTKRFTTHNSQFIIEEPELNLFPETQRDLVYYLLEKCNDKAREHRMTITTHSPYILYALNNCMMAGLVYDKMREKDKERLKCKSALIDPKKVSIYQIDEGRINCIQQDDGLIGNNYFDENVKELMDDFYLMLNYYGK
ncbi:hypothetical protein EZS27_002160 [termite gut metagenome]|uniref:Uncharacterized protein n=1 Tax=termite gut metagenome TaxID=433724 RepID=A0A5J4SYJ7_9ZZZZ